MTDEELKALVASNAQAIQALSRDVAQLVETQQEQSQTWGRVLEDHEQILEKLTETQGGMVRMLTSLDEDRPTIFSKLNAIEGKIDRLLSPDQG